MDKQQNFNTLDNFNGKTAIIYARASTQAQENKIQIDDLQKFCKLNGITVKGIYQEKISGAKEHREELETILDSESMADLLIVREVSRLSREKDYLAALEKIRTLTKKYSIIIKADNYYIPKGQVIELSDGITMMIKLWSAADEREKIKIRTSTARNKYRENPINVSTGTRYTPFGLMKAENPNYSKGVNTKQIWKENPDEWPIVEQIFELKSKGYSYSKISNMLGITEQIIIQTIKSPKIRYYIDSVLLDRTDKATELNNTNPNPHKYTNKYKNRIFFEDTNTAMAHQYTKKGGFQYAKKGGIGGSIKVEIIDSMVKTVIDFLLDFTEIKQDEIRAQNQEKINELTTLIDGLQNTIIKNQDKIKDLNKKYINAPNDDIMIEIRSRIEETTKEIKTLENQISNYKIEISKLESIKDNAFNVDDNFETLIEKYIQRIECYHAAKFQHHFKIFASIVENYGLHFEFLVHHHNKIEISPLAVVDESGNMRKFDKSMQKRLEILTK